MNVERVLIADAFQYVLKLDNRNSFEMLGACRDC